MTDRGMPKCPWCGREMHIGYDGKGMAFGRCYFYCDCGAQAPCACVEYATPEDWIGIEGAAYLKATARPMQKPLTVEELMEIPGSVWYENDTVIAPMMVSNQKSFSVLYLKDVVFGVYRSCAFDSFAFLELPILDYGKTWRCWAEKPTEEERKAAEWEK